MRSISLLEAAQLRERGVVILRLQQRLQPRIHFAPEALLASRMTQRVRIKCSQPVRIGDQEIARRLRAAEQRDENANLFVRHFPQFRPGWRGRQ
jgi:hypothetical protein